MQTKATNCPNEGNPSCASLFVEAAPYDDDEFQSQSSFVAASPVPAQSEAWARRNRVAVVRYPPNWERLGKRAGKLRNALHAGRQRAALCDRVSWRAKHRRSGGEGLAGFRCCARPARIVAPTQASGRSERRRDNAFDPVPRHSEPPTRCFGSGGTGTEHVLRARQTFSPVDLCDTPHLFVPGA
jgi:hypothetical protein